MIELVINTQKVIDDLRIHYCNLDFGFDINFGIKHKFDAHLPNRNTFSNSYIDSQKRGQLVIRQTS